MKTSTARFAFCVSVALFFSAAASAQNQPFEPGFGQPGQPGNDNPSSNPVALTDGTPLSTTTIVAADIANSNALMAADTALLEFPAEAPEPAAAAPVDQASSALVGAEGGLGSYKINGVKADLWTLTVPYSVRIDDRSTVVTTWPFTTTNYRNVTRANGTVGNSKVYGWGANAGWRYRIVGKQDNVHYRWNLTPTGGIYLRRSGDLNMGSWVYNLGISSSFAYQLPSGWILNLGNSITMAWNSGYSHYPDPIRDNQQVVMNGLQLMKPIGRWMVAGKVVDTRYLRSNLVNGFDTFALSAGYRVTPTRSLHVSLIAETGTGYHSVSGILGSKWRF